MDNKISALQAALQRNMTVDVRHTSVYSLHRFDVDNRHALYIENDVLEKKTLDDVLKLLSTYQVADILNSAKTPTYLLLSDSGLRDVEVNSKKVPVTHTHTHTEKEKKIPDYGFVGIFICGEKRRKKFLLLTTSRPLQP